MEGYRGILARKDKIAIPDRYFLDRGRGWIISLYEVWGKPAKAAAWQSSGNRGYLFAQPKNTSVVTSAA